jgi:hypothetical protein
MLLPLLLSLKYHVVLRSLLTTELFTFAWVHMLAVAQALICLVLEEL